MLWKYVEDLQIQGTSNAGELGVFNSVQDTPTGSGNNFHTRQTSFREINVATLFICGSEGAWARTRYFIPVHVGSWVGLVGSVPPSVSFAAVAAGLGLRAQDPFGSILRLSTKHINTYKSI